MKLIIDCDDQQEVGQVQEALGYPGELLVQRAGEPEKAGGPALVADEVQVTVMGSPIAPPEG